MKPRSKSLSLLATRVRRAARRLLTPHLPVRPVPELRAQTQFLLNKNVLITGAGRNIGRSIALEMASQGANVYCTDIDAERVKTTSAELQESGAVSRGFVSDVSSPTDVASLCDELQNSNVCIDVLINNVGLDTGAADSSILQRQDLQHSFETNVIGPLDLTQRIVRQMIATGRQGSIIFVTSIHQWAVRKSLAYSSAKAALGMVVAELAVELAPHGIRVNGIAPGAVREDEDGQPLPHPWAVLHGSTIKPCFIGRAAVYLAADYFSWFTTGAVLKIDGGLSLGNHCVYSQPPY